MFAQLLRNTYIMAVCLVSSNAQAQWLSPYYIDHPLVGKIFSLQDNRWVSREHLENSLRDVRVLLLGETHTNPDHHQGQADLLGAWISESGPYALVLEMLNLESWQDQPTVWSSLERLQDALESKDGAWEWELYRPVLERAVKHKLPVIAGNITRQQRKYFGEKGHCRLEQYGKEFDFCDTISAEQRAVMETLVADSHCGYLQSQQVKSLVRTQVAKDASFAFSLKRAESRYRVALIAGSVHVRKDIGVPLHLQELGIDSVSIAFVSVDPEKTKPGEYFSEELGRSYDYIFFTPSERNIDPCVEFAEQLKKMKEAEEN